MSLWKHIEVGAAEFWSGFVKGAKETPLAYFAPAVAAWRLLVSTSEHMIARAHQRPSERL